MNKLFIQRYVAATRLFLKLKNASSDGYVILYDGCILDPKNIVLDSLGIRIVIGADHTEWWFENNPDFDHGIYTSIKDFETNVRNTFKVVKMKEDW